MRGALRLAALVASGAAAAVASNTSTPSVKDATVTVWETDYTTICPTTSEIIVSGSLTTTTTFLSTSTGTTTLTSVLPSSPSSSPVATSSALLVSSVTSAVSSSSYVSTVASSSPAAIPTLGQVGSSTFGQLDSGCYPKWLPRADGKPYLSAPWGNRTTKNADAVNPNDIPDTGVTRYYDFTVSRARISPDGVLRDVILINGQYPAPAIEANWGDMINVTLHNEIYAPDEGTSLHWHGMLQKKTPWFDGVPAVDQCPIAPGHSFTYVYQAELYGTSWYHAHYSAQYTAGVVGPMVIYGPTQADYDCDIGPVMLSDWYHIPYFSIVQDSVGTNLSLIPPSSDSNLIQGRNTFNCSEKGYNAGNNLLASNLESEITFQCEDNAPLSNFTFKAGKTHRLRLINYAADGIQKFSIDGLNLTVIAVDYVPVVPYTTDVVTLGVAQRTDVLVTAPNDTTASYWMRAEDIGGAFCGGSSNPLALAGIYNEDADTSVAPVTTSSINNTLCANDALSATVPEYSITPSTSTYVQDLAISLDLNSTGSYEWRLNNQTFRANFNHPILFLAAEGNVSYPDDPQWNVYNFGQNTSVTFNLTNDTPFTHPFHMHGHNFYVLAEGSSGVWNGSVTNPTNPTRRDTQLVQGLGWVAIQMEQDNPGVWPFHCHVAWHLSGGLALNIMSRPEDIPAIPDIMPQTCLDWDFYTSTQIVDQIDAGS